MNAPRIARRKVCQTLSPKTNRYFAATLRKIIPNQYEAISNRHEGKQCLIECTPRGGPPQAARAPEQKFQPQGTGGSPIGFCFAAQKSGSIDDENP